MSLSDDKFNKICEKLSRALYNLFKINIARELDSLSKENKGLMDENTAVNIILTSMAILDGNIMMMCKNVCKNLNMDKLVKSHHILMEGVINDCIKHQKTN